MSELTPAAKAAVLKALMDSVKVAYEKGRAEADDLLRALHEQHGVISVEVRLPGVDGKVATLTLSVPEAAVAVDETGRLEWCQDRYPDEVETETVTHTRVRPAFVKVLAGRLAVDEPTGKVIDLGTGEVLAWARQVPAGPPTSTLTFAKTGRASIAGAHGSGVLSLPALLALPAEAGP